MHILITRSQNGVGTRVMCAANMLLMYSTFQGLYVLYFGNVLKLIMLVTNALDYKEEYLLIQ